MGDSDAIQPGSCSECGSPLAHDQRYCLACGARRGSPPRYVSLLLGEIRERGRRPAPSMPAPSDVTSHGGLDALAKAPRAAAAAILAMLGFGAFVGSLVGGAGASDPGAIVVAYAPPPAQTAPTATTPAVTTPVQPARTVTVDSPAASRAAPRTSSPAGGKTTTTKGDGTAPTRPVLPPIAHVFLIVLSNQGYAQSFGDSTSAPFLTKTLAAKGEVIGSYYAVAGGSLANEIALISGQGPTLATQANCPQFGEIQPGTTDEGGQVHGDGCGYPAGVITIGEELKAAHLTWKAYLGTHNATDDAKAERCRPLPGSTTADAGAYAAWRNPFLYFDAPKGACPKENVALAQLDKDLASERETPALSYIVPDLCDSGAPTPCEPSAKPGMEAADAFLGTVVPKIEKSPAYKSGGMIAITFDQAPQSGPQADSTSCCGQPTYPNLTAQAPPAPPAPPATTPPATAPPATAPPATAPPATAPPATTPTDTTPTDTTPTDTAPTDTNAPPETTPTDTAPTDITVPPAPTAPPATTAPPPSTTQETSPTTNAQTTPPPAAATTTTPDAGGGDGPGQAPAQPPGGGRVGLLLLSKYVKPDTINAFDSFNHFSLLASIEDLFGLDRLGYAAASGLPVFGASVYTAYASS